MKEEISLSEQVELAKVKGSLEEFSNLIIKLYEQNDDETLDLCIELAMSDFGGITHKSDFQNTAALGTLHWG
jgi:hypothetical protein